MLKRDVGRIFENRGGAGPGHTHFIQTQLGSTYTGSWAVLRCIALASVTKKRFLDKMPIKLLAKAITIYIYIIYVYIYIYSWVGFDGIYA